MSKRCAISFLGNNDVLLHKCKSDSCQEGAEKHMLTRFPLAGHYDGDSKSIRLLLMSWSTAGESNAVHTMWHSAGCDQ